MILTRLQFRERFTLAEKTAIYSAAASQIVIQVWLDDLMAAEHIDTSLPETIAGVRGLEQAGLLAAGRADVILRGEHARVLPPFNEAWPDTYAILVEFEDGSVRLQDAGDFAPQYIERVVE